MANKIVLKKSSVPAKAPLSTDLEYGELAINYADGKLYYKDSSDVVQFFDSDTSSFVTLSGTQTITDKIITSPTINGGEINNAVIGSSVPAAGTFTVLTATGTITSTHSSGDGGGEIQLAVPQTNTSIASGVAIDVYQNKLRIFEVGGTNRGVYIDLTAASAGVSTDLISGGVSGVSGASGYSGYSGYSGISGYSGLTGPQGDPGTSGYSGISGYSGYSGYSGQDGSIGVDGASGYSGYSGYSGAVGPIGTSGYSGYSGYSGTTGPQGVQGVSGYSGYSGYSGQDGSIGVDGASGYSGYSGISGYSGYSGQDGSIGVDGASGYSGYSGYSGAQGPTVYPSAGIPLSTGTSWDTSYSTTGTGDVVLNTFPTLSTGFKLNAVGVSGYTPIAETIASIVSNDNQFKTFYLQNRNSGSDASSDFIVYNDQASENAMSYYIDMGINSSNFSSASWPIFPANSAYLLVAGGDPEAVSPQPSHLYIGTGTPDSDIVLFAGGIELTNKKVIVKADTGNILINTINDDGLNKLQVNGGANFTGSVNVDGAVYLGSAITYPTQAATKAYVDNAAATGIHVHTPVRVEKHGSWTVSYTDGGTTLTVTDIADGKTLTTSTSHGLAVNDVVYFTSTTNGLTLNTAYFVYSTPTSDTFLISSQYMGDELATLTNGTGLSITCKANTGVGATLTNAGTQAALNVGGINLSVGNRVAVIRSVDKYQNGIYTVTDIGSDSTNWVLTRATDNDTYAPHDTDALSDGDYFYVQEGSPGAGESYVITTDAPILFGISDITFTLFNAAVAYNVVAPLNLTGTTLSLAGTVGETNGGTGQSTVTTGDLLYGSGTNTWSKLPLGVAYKSLTVNGTGTQLEWNAVALNQNAAVSGVLRLVNGGTGSNLTAVNGGIVYSTSSALDITSAGTAGQILKSTGAGAPSWVDPTTIVNAAVSDTAPTSPANGNLWWKSDEGALKIYYEDTDSSQWVDAWPTKIINNQTASDVPLIKTTNYSVATSEWVYCNTQSGSFTITLPSAPSAGNYVKISSGRYASINNLNIERNGQTIMGLSENMTISTSNVTVTLVYDGSSWGLA